MHRNNCRRVRACTNFRSRDTSAQFFQAAFETLGGTLIKFSRDAVNFHGVAPAMAGPVFDTGDQIAVGRRATTRHIAVEEVANRLDDSNIGALGATADAINPPRRLKLGEVRAHDLRHRANHASAGRRRKWVEACLQGRSGYRAESASRGTGKDRNCCCNWLSAQAEQTCAARPGPDDLPLPYWRHRVNWGGGDERR